MKKLGFFLVFSLFFALGMSAQTAQKPKKGTPKPTTSVGQKPAPAPSTTTATTTTEPQKKNTVPRRKAVIRKKPIQAAPAPDKKQTMQKGQ